jgi:hypothetical protein
MHPADEFVAMAALNDTGEAIDAVATRFGVFRTPCPPTAAPR